MEKNDKKLLFKPDNRILESAVSGNADIIVSGDKAMLTLKDYKGIKIITLRVSQSFLKY